MENLKNNIVNLDNEFSKEKLFDEIYDEFFERVYKFSSYRVNNKEDAHDITSNIFIKIYKNIDTYNEDKSHLAVWIFTIARNTIYDYYRKKNKFKMISIDKFKDFFSSEKYVEDNIEKLEEYDYLRLKVQELEEKEKMLISYKYGAELTNIEIASLMDISVSNVGVINHRAVKKLRSEMEAYYEK